MPDNENIAKNGWSEYGRLVLKELERLNDGQDAIKRDLDLKFLELCLDQRLQSSPFPYRRLRLHLQQLNVGCGKEHFLTR